MFVQPNKGRQQAEEPMQTYLYYTVQIRAMEI